MILPFSNYGIPVKVILAATIAFAAFFSGGYLGWTVGSAKVVELREKHAKALAKAEEAARLQERSYAESQEHVSRKYEEHRQELERAAAGARADSERLRAAIAAYTRAASSSACQPDDRAATLGELLGEADGLAEENARAADFLAEQVRGLQELIVKQRGE
jgi:hypothetical protein